MKKKKNITSRRSDINEDKLKTVSVASAIKKTSSNKIELDGNGNKKSKNLIKRIKSFINWIILTIAGYMVLSIIEPFGLLTNPFRWLDDNQCAKNEKKLDTIYKNSFGNLEEILPLIDKLKNKDKYEDTYNFYKGYYLANSNVISSILGESSPEEYLYSISLSSKYYDDSKIILFSYYFTMYLDGNIALDFFTEKLSFIIDDMRNNGKIGYPFHFFLSQYGFWNSSHPISEIYDNYNYMQRTFKIKYEPPYSRTSKPLYLDERYNLDKEVSKTNPTDFYYSKIKIDLIQYYYIISILQKKPLNPEEEKIQKEFSRFLFFKDQNEFINYFTDLATGFIMFTKCNFELNFLHIPSTLIELQKKYYPENVNTVNFDENDMLKSIIISLIKQGKIQITPND